ncbi:kinetochore CENP-C fungal-like protein [Talaromyces proteolyticus]|uniref:CENP-C homolog n=1 Tax=Talaromyces proteolyticus TaxID=1131652 RepID=A0AAD4L131_9EURO|nr:kinetochore CENP-C fungal-like protein [Talaromyces proteolyticus]KAH8704273.1 kinetochore CENP-C fungal-like protein [Talaromyces proteolyticus]
MAPRGAPKARDYDYSNVGKQGRRTGITLKEGRLDEHGMEELDGVFSSPEKSPVRVNGMHTGNDTIMGSEGMSMDEDEAPDPADFLRPGNRRSPYLPPPVSRSPRKSGLSGSPRRTPGLRSSPFVQNDQDSSSPSALHQRVNNPKATSTLSGRRPLNDRRPNTAPIANGLRQKSKEFDASRGFSDNENDPVQEDDAHNDNAFDTGVNDIHVIDGPYEAGSDDFIAPVDTGHQDISEQDSPSIHASISRGVNRSIASTRFRDAEDDDYRTPKESPRNPLKRSRPGRPPKTQSTAQDSEGRPAKKAKPSRKEPSPPLAPLDPELEKVVENHVSRTGPLKGRSLYILKRETPSEDQSTHTRSGRVSVRPLAYWRNERCVYGDGEAGIGQRYPLSTIKEIIRTEELEPENNGKKKRRAKNKSKNKKENDDDSEDEDDTAIVDEWESQDGVLHGYVKKWDAANQAASLDEEQEVLDIAYAPSGIETRVVKDCTFRFAKVLSHAFIGSGMVEIPPKGVKKPKNSKRMHMVFYVCQGRVQVDVNGIQFTAGKGCVFQVPRGNHYSFANIYHKDARLFFTQAFLPTEEENTTENISKEAVEPDLDSEVPLPRPKGRGRGRPKAKAASKA